MYFCNPHNVYKLHRSYVSNKLTYSEKIWCGENLAQLAQNGKNRQIESASNLIFSLAVPN